MDRELILPSRRRFLRGVGGLAALAASVGAPRKSNAGAGGKHAAAAERAAQPPGIRIRAVDAYPVYINQRSEGLLDAPSFASDDDPRRWRYDGPFAQLPSAIIAVVKTDQGIVGFGMGAGGSAAVEIIHSHLRHLLIDVDPLNVEQRWDQMYSSALFYGRRGLFTMALSAVDNALWDIAGKHAGRPVHELLGGQPRDRIAIYQSGGNIPRAQAAGVAVGNSATSSTCKSVVRGIARAIRLQTYLRRLRGACGLRAIMESARGVPIGGSASGARIVHRRTPAPVRPMCHPSLCSVQPSWYETGEASRYAAGRAAVKARPSVHTAHTIRASLFATATAPMLCPRRVDLLVAIGFQQRFRVGRIALVPPDIPMDVVRLQEAHRVPQAGELTSPIMGRPARFEQHRRGRARHEELGLSGFPNAILGPFGVFRG